MFGWFNKRTPPTLYEHVIHLRIVLRGREEPLLITVRQKDRDMGGDWGALSFEGKYIAEDAFKEISKEGVTVAHKGGKVHYAPAIIEEIHLEQIEKIDITEKA